MICNKSPRSGLLSALSWFLTSNVFPLHYASGFNSKGAFVNSRCSTVVPFEIPNMSMLMASSLSRDGRHIDAPSVWMQPSKQTEIPPLVIWHLILVSFVVYREWVNLAVIGAWHLFLWTSLLYRQRYIVCPSSDKYTYFITYYFG